MTIDLSSARLIRSMEAPTKGDAIDEYAFEDHYDTTGDDKVNYIKNYRLNLEGEEQIQEEKFDLDGNSIFEQRLSYDSNNKLCYEDNYNNETGKIDNEKKYDSDGSLISIEEFTYSDEGKTERSVTKDSDGNILKTHELIRNDNGDIARLLTKDADGNIEHGIINEFNEDGSIKSETWLYPNNGYTYTYNLDGTRTKNNFDRLTPDVISAEEGSNSKNDEGFFDKISRYGEEIISGILNFLGIKN